MGRPNPATLFAFLAAALVVLGLGIALKGGLYIAKHEGDTLHLLEIVLRIAAGERIHQDFMTPIGVLAFAPISMFIKLGFGAGHALIYAQLLVAVLSLPAIWWVAYTRLSGAVAYFLGLYLVVLALALTYGEAEASVSMSMHYNRWAWVASYLAILLAVLPSRQRRSQPIDGAVIGVAMAALVLLKVTYFAAFAIPITVSLVMRGAWRTLIAAALSGLIVAVMATFWGGMDFWLAYIDDLRGVSASEMRPQPSNPLGNLLGAPAFLGVNLVLLAAVALMRQARHERVGLVLLLLAPGFVYVTYQNFGNDPQWLILLIVLLMTLRPETDMRNGFGWNMRNAFQVTAAAAMAFAVPSFFNLLYSPYRHLNLDTSKYTALLPRDPVNQDLQTLALRANRVDGRIALDGTGSGLEFFREAAERKDIVSLNGEELRACELELGISAWYYSIAADLEGAGYGGRKIFEADIFEALPLFGDFGWLGNGSPWYYGGAPGIDDATLVLVPFCPIATNARKMKLDALAEAGIKLKELRRTTLYILLEKEAG